MATPIETFAALVREMREAQKEYFRMRDRASLRRATALERRVDEEARKIRCGEAKEQRSLF